MEAIAQKTIQYVPNDKEHVKFVDGIKNSIQKYGRPFCPVAGTPITGIFNNF